jgi:hypothetical protein
MYQTEIYHFCTTIAKLNARWLSRCSIYWNVNASTSKYQLMCQTEIYHYCTTIVELNARWLTRYSIYWTINDSRSKYQLMCWRHPTFLDTRPWYRGNQFIELYIHSWGPTTPFSPSIPHSAPLLCFTLLASDERQSLACSLLLRLQPCRRTNLHRAFPASLLHPDLW